MGKYSSNMRQAPPPATSSNPIWRGFGCLMIVIIPVISYAAAFMLVDIGAKQGWPIPYQLMGQPAIHPLLWKVTSLVPLWAFIQSQNNLYAILSLALLIIIILASFISIIYAFMFRSAVPRYGPLDVPPPNIKVKHYKR